MKPLTPAAFSKGLPSSAPPCLDAQNYPAPPGTSGKLTQDPLALSILGFCEGRSDMLSMLWVGRV